MKQFKLSVMPLIAFLAIYLGISGYTTSTAEATSNFVAIADTGVGSANHSLRHCDCSQDLYSCSDFQSQEDAQACYWNCGAQNRGDIHKLDLDVNMVACDILAPQEPTNPAPSTSGSQNLRSCDCSQDIYDCSDFQSQEDAQACYWNCGAQNRGDVHKLDVDANRVACDVLAIDMETGSVGSAGTGNADEAIGDANFEATDWTVETHSKDADPNFDEVFEDEAVKRLDIVITEERWQSMLDNMTDIYGAFGVGGGRPRQGSPDEGGPGEGRLEGERPRLGGPGEGRPRQGGPGGGAFSEEDPIFVPAELFYEDREWYRVGVRFKGNSSLRNSWPNGILKLSFKLDFDEFEDDYPQIDNQRFYGFKKLSLKNNFNDRSMLREKVASDIFRNAGLAASHTAFYAVYVDHGDGPIYFGLYTLVEEVDNTVIDTQFSSDDGNLYKPDGGAATFAEGTFDEAGYVKKTNEDEADFSDVESLLTILHDDTRTTDPATWRANLEAVFDTDLFLKYLATNTVIQNWDTYGRMTHNYYLYNDPDTGKLTWIPWDHNEALQVGERAGPLELDFSDLEASQWPLIEYLYEDSVYKAQYDTYLQEVIDGAFNVNTIQSTYATYSALIEPYATTEISGYTFLNSSTDFQTAIDRLKTHVVERATAVNNYLTSSNTRE